MEPYWRGLAHTTGNASFLRVARAAYPDEPIAFLAERRHIEAVLDDLPDMTGLSTHALDIPDENASPYARVLRDWRNASSAFRLLRDDPRGVLALCSAYRSSIGVCALARRLTGSRRQRIIARLHGNLNEVTRQRSANPLRQALRLETSLEVARRSGVRLIVLERSIRSELITLRPMLDGHVDVLEEPATVEPVGIIDVPEPGKTVRFAFLGVGTRDKGVDRFLAAAEEVRRTSGTAEFELIGRLHPSMAELSTAGLARRPSEAPIPRRAYVESVDRQHYVCAFYDRAYYRLGASGVLLDAIAHRKPLIVTDIPFARDLFDRFGDLGDLCRTDEDAVNAIKRAASAQDPARYRRQVENLGRVARSREISALAPRLRAIIESIA